MRGRHYEAAHGFEQPCDFGILHCQSDSLSAGPGLREQGCKDCEGESRDIAVRCRKYSSFFFFNVIILIFFFISLQFCLGMMQRLITQQAVDQKGARYITDALWMLMELGMEEVKVLQTVTLLLTSNTVVHGETLARVATLFCFLF